VTIIVCLGWVKAVVRARAATRALPFALLLLGCNGVQQTTYEAPDSGAGCSVLPTIPCDAVEQTSATCTGQGGPAGNSAALPVDASFPPGCQAYFRGIDCSSRGFCTCDAEDDAGTPAHWSCGGIDGG